MNNFKFKFQKFADTGQLLTDLSKEIKLQSSLMLKIKNKLNFLVTGGSMIQEVILSILSLDQMGKVPPFGINIWLTDERVLPKNSLNRNDTKLSSALLTLQQTKHLVVKNWQAYSPNGMNSSCKLYDQDLNSSLGRLKFDATILTIGSDGHLAGLWPQHFISSQGSIESFSHSIGSPPFQDRVTLSLKRISHSKKIFLYLIGDDKISLFFDLLPKYKELNFLNSNNVYIMMVSGKK
jgi:6-phosphogluconolactonase/glucosamine-6-phosphate isomerase/deaminase